MINPSPAIDERRRLWREATTMTLYVTIVLLAELSALSTAIVGWELVAIVWGTTIGLVLAHAFAFQVATHGLTGGRLTPADRQEVLWEIAGSAMVAAAATIPVILLSADTEQSVVRFVLVAVLGTIGYLVERANGRSRRASIAFAGAVLVVGLIVAGVKTVLVH